MVCVSKTSDTITIRVPEELKNQLETICKRQKINMNLLINQILEKSVNWDAHLSKMGWVTFQPKLVKEIFTHITKKEMEDISSKNSLDIIESIKFLYGDKNFESLIMFFDSWLQSSNFPYRHDEINGSHKFIVEHKLGQNWSEFATIISKYIVNGMGFQITNIEFGENQYSYMVEQS